MREKNKEKLLFINFYEHIVNKELLRRYNRIFMEVLYFRKYDTSTSSRDLHLFISLLSSIQAFHGLSNKIQGIHSLLISNILFTLSSISSLIQKSLHNFDFGTSFSLN
jgi:hypothetical protein